MVILISEINELHPSSGFELWLPRMGTYQTDYILRKTGKMIPHFPGLFVHPIY